MKILCQIIRLYVPFMCTVLGLVHGILFFTHQLTDERIYLLSALFSMLVSLYIVATSRKMCRWYKLNTLFLSIIQLLGIVLLQWGCIPGIAVSFTLSYLALWVELLLNLLNLIYTKTYGKIYPSETGERDSSQTD